MVSAITEIYKTCLLILVFVDGKKNIHKSKKKKEKKKELLACSAVGKDLGNIHQNGFSRNRKFT